MTTTICNIPTNLKPIERTFDCEIIQKLNYQLNFDEKEFFIKQFYGYLKYDEEKDFCVDLDDTWEWLGYSKKANAASKFYKLNFKENVEYKIISAATSAEKNEDVNLAYPDGEASYGSKHGNSKKILMTLRTFKKFCLKSCTNKADDVHDYFLAMERVINQLVKESQYVCFSKDQFNNSKKLLNHFGDDTDIMYTILFEYNGKIYIKLGMVHILTFNKRHEKHVVSFGEGDIKSICIYSAIKCKDVAKVESEFKKTPFYNINKTNITVNGRNFTEIIELTDNVTAEMIKERIHKVAGDRILDPPPRYTAIETSSDSNLEIEKEKTKQLELTTQLELKKLEFEMMKFKLQNYTPQIQEEIQIESHVAEIEAWLKEHIIYEQDAILQLKEVVCLYTGVDRVHSKVSSKFKKQIEDFIKSHFVGHPFMYTDSTFKKSRYRGWLNFKLF
jgi:hypothetical protein